MVVESTGSNEDVRLAAAAQTKTESETRAMNPLGSEAR